MYIEYLYTEKFDNFLFIMTNILRHFWRRIFFFFMKLRGWDKIFLGGGYEWGLGGFFGVRGKMWILESFFIKKKRTYHKII